MIWRLLLAAGLWLHGLVHLIGVAAALGLGRFEGVPASPAFPAGLAGGDPLVQALGVGWALAAAGFLASAIGVAAGATWWPKVAAASAGVSLALCLAWWSDTTAGALIDVVILAGLAVRALAFRPAAAG
jgi:hypothetical protein